MLLSLKVINIDGGLSRVLRSCVFDLCDKTETWYHKIIPLLASQPQKPRPGRVSMLCAISLREGGTVYMGIL